MSKKNTISEKGKNKFYLKTLVFILSASIMMGHGARMIFQGVFKPNSYYVPGTFDIFFDWLTLLILGIIIFYFTLTNFYKKISEDKKYKISTN